MSAGLAVVETLRDPARALRSPRSGGRHTATRDRLVVAIILIATWQGLNIAFGAYWMPSPWSTLSRLIAGVVSGHVQRHALYTTFEAVFGFVIGGVPAVGLALLLRRMPTATAILEPFMTAGYGVPKLALAPLFILWFGAGMVSKVALVAISVSFVLYFSTKAGIRAIDMKLVQTARILGAAQHHVTRLVIVPAAAPYILAGVRIAVPYLDRWRGDRGVDLRRSRSRLSRAVQRRGLRHDRGICRAHSHWNHRIPRQQRGHCCRAAPSALALWPCESVVSGQPLLDIRNLGKCYASQHRDVPPWVIKDLTFSVAAGEFVTIVGPSGAGKTTLLNVLAQIDSATSGEIRFMSDRIPVEDGAVLDPGFSCRVGYVTQDDNLLPWRTTIDNVLLPLELQRRLTPQTRAQAQTLLLAVGLGGFELRYPHQLSGGMRKRAALVRTLVYDPPVILMDEPFNAVDAETRTMLQEDLLKLWDVGRKTIIFVTHDIGEAIALGDRTLVLTNAPPKCEPITRSPFRARATFGGFQLNRSSKICTGRSGRCSPERVGRRQRCSRHAPSGVDSRAFWHWDVAAGRLGIVIAALVAWKLTADRAGGAVHR